MLELGPTGSLRPRLDPLAVQRAFESVRADGRTVGHWTRAIGGSAFQGRATVAGPSIPFHAAENSKNPLESLERINSVRHFESQVGGRELLLNLEHSQCLTCTSFSCCCPLVTTNLHFSQEDKR